VAAAHGTLGRVGVAREPSGGGVDRGQGRAPPLVPGRDPRTGLVSMLPSPPRPDAPRRHGAGSSSSSDRGDGDSGGGGAGTEAGPSREEGTEAGPSREELWRTPFALERAYAEQRREVARLRRAARRARVAGVGAAAAAPSVAMREASAAARAAEAAEAAADGPPPATPRSVYLTGHHPLRSELVGPASGLPSARGGGPSAAGPGRSIQDLLGRSLAALESIRARGGEGAPAPPGWGGASARVAGGGSIELLSSLTLRALEPKGADAQPSARSGAPASARRAPLAGAFARNERGARRVEQRRGHAEQRGAPAAGEPASPHGSLPAAFVRSPGSADPARRPQIRAPPPSAPAPRRPSLLQTPATHPTRPKRATVGEISVTAACCFPHH
jgi:hypothetical protein